MNDSADVPPGGYRALVDNFPNGVIVLFNAELRYKIVGPETLPFSGREATEMVGKTIFELFPEETASELEPNLQATIEGSGRSFDLDFEDRIHHLETKPAQIEGESYGILLTQEVTEERQTAQELKEQNKRLEKFASVVSHDLRNPLNVALGRLELIDEEDVTVHHDAIESALERLNRIIEDVLWLTREGQDIGSVTSVELSQVVDSAWTMVADQSDRATLRYADDDRQVTTITADYGRLCQLLENMFANAIEHGGEDVTVTVGLLENGFYIEDDGPGILEEHRDEVFEVGFSTATEGTGFGLHIVKQVAEAHGWKIHVTDGAQGGSRFEFTGVGISE